MHVTHTVGINAAYMVLVKFFKSLISFFQVLVLTTTCRAMAQAVIRRRLITEARVHTQVNVCRICGVQSGTGADFTPSPLAFPCHYHSTATPHSLTYHLLARQKASQLSSLHRQSHHVYWNISEEASWILSRNSNFQVTARSVTI
jgi:hypothetical protein